MHTWRFCFLLFLCLFKAFDVPVNFRSLSLGWKSPLLCSPQIHDLDCQSFLPPEPSPTFSLVLRKEGLDLEVLLQLNRKKTHQTKRRET